MTTKPFLKWVGGKSGTISQISQYFPDRFNTYIEPFVGGGAVFFSLGYSYPAILSDQNEELINLYWMIKKNPHELMRVVDVLSNCYSEAHYYGVRAWKPEEDMHRAARTLFLNKTGFNGLYRQNQKGEFNVPFGKRETCPAIYSKENVLAASMALQNSFLTFGDFEKVIDKSIKGDFVYCDPPYDPLTESSFSSYTKSGFSQHDHKRLKDACVAAALRGVTVLVSNSPTDYIRDLYADHEQIEIQARRSVNSNGKGRGVVKELLIRV